MDAERITTADVLGADIVHVWLTPGELNRLRFEASIAATSWPDRYGAWAEFLEASDDV